MRLSVMAVLVAIVLACAPAKQAVDPAERADIQNASQPGSEIEFDEIAGIWRIVSIDGTEAAAMREDGGTERTPHLRFWKGGYGGTSGCNFFGGLGLLVGDRYYAASGPQTLIGCGQLAAQEDAFTSTMGSMPMLDVGDGSLILTTQQHRLVLRRDPGLAARLTPTAPQEEPELLAGSSWIIQSLDGQPLARPGETDMASMRFEAQTWSARAACATVKARWRQQDDRIITLGPLTSTEQRCPADNTAFDDRLAALMASDPKFVTGPNGEIFIAGGGHWLSGLQAREQLNDDSALVTGSWRVIDIDGQPPSAGSEPAVIFAPAGYAGSTGCNSITGLYLAHARRLFTNPGLQSARGCGPLEAQEDRINALLASSPRIALAGSDAIALVDRSGRLLLQRVRDAGVALAAPSAGAAATTLHAELHTFDGEHLRVRSTDPESWISLEDDTWELRIGCIALGGAIRREHVTIHFFTDGRPMPAPGCRESGGELGRRLMRMMNGKARGLRGVNGEFLLAGREHWLTGRLDRR